MCDSRTLSNAANENANGTDTKKKKWPRNTHAKDDAVVEWCERNIVTSVAYVILVCWCHTSNKSKRMASE